MHASPRYALRAVPIVVAVVALSGKRPYARNDCHRDNPRQDHRGEAYERADVEGFGTLSLPRFPQKTSRAQPHQRHAHAPRHHATGCAFYSHGHPVWVNWGGQMDKQDRPNKYTNIIRDEKEINQTQREGRHFAK